MSKKLAVLLTGLLMAAIMMALAIPAFAAEPSLFYIQCQDESLIYHGFSNTGADFGYTNRQALSPAQLGFTGDECVRTIQ